MPDGKPRAHAGERLAHLVLREGMRIGTGFVGTPVLCDALCETGHADVAYALLEQTECPSWLYPVLLGATTIWERWDGLRPDGTINPGEMNSFNHYALGAVGDWLHRTVAGLAPAAPGYRAIRVDIQTRGFVAVGARSAHDAVRTGVVGVAHRRRRADRRGGRPTEHVGDRAPAAARTDHGRLRHAHLDPTASAYRSIARSVGRARATHEHVAVGRCFERLGRVFDGPVEQAGLAGVADAGATRPSHRHVARLRQFEDAREPVAPTHVQRRSHERDERSRARRAFGLMRRPRRAQRRLRA